MGEVTEGIVLDISGTGRSVRYGYEHNGRRYVGSDGEGWNDIQTRSCVDIQLLNGSFGGTRMSGSSHSCLDSKQLLMFGQSNLSADTPWSIEVRQNDQAKSFDFASNWYYLEPYVNTNCTLIYKTLGYRDKVLIMFSKEAVEYHRVFQLEPAFVIGSGSDTTRLIYNNEREEWLDM